MELQEIKPRNLTDKIVDSMSEAEVEVIPGTEVEAEADAEAEAKAEAKSEAKAEANAEANAEAEAEVEANTNVEPTCR